MQTKLGLLGLGEISTLFYINELEKVIDSNNKSYKVYQTNFDEINNILPHPSEKLKEIVSKNINSLLNLDVNTLLIPNITLHQTMDSLKLDVNVIHPLKETVVSLKKENCTEVVLLGSIYTMQSDYIKLYFSEHGISIKTPLENEQSFIDNLRKKVFLQTANAALIADYNLIIKKYAQKNAVVIACTELSVASQISNGRIFDMARIQIKEALRINQQ